jgi:SAM-dependent methyltransferase
MNERSFWNILYRRALSKAERPPAELDSVPVQEQWGTLPREEWIALEFLTRCCEDRASWLDIGCGTGSILAAFLGRYPHATASGLDISDAAISIGLQHLRRRPDLHRRMTLQQGNIAAEGAILSGGYDLAYALFSLQFLSSRQFLTLAGKLKEKLREGGVFAGVVRSSSRSVPASYSPCPHEPNTYISGEPHESGMLYHHYTEAEIRLGAEVLGGELVYLREIFNTRVYDKAPRRAWWQFVVMRSLTP